MSWNNSDPSKARERAERVVIGRDYGQPRAMFMVCATEDGNIHTVSFAEESTFDGPDGQTHMSQKRLMSRVLMEAMTTLEPVRQAAAQAESDDALGFQ